MSGVDGPGPSRCADVAANQGVEGREVGCDDDAFEAIVVAGGVEGGEVSRRYRGGFAGDVYPPAGPRRDSGFGYR